MWCLGARGGWGRGGGGGWGGGERGRGRDLDRSAGDRSEVAFCFSLILVAGKQSVGGNDDEIVAGYG